jgi:hypothetical protein
MPNDDQYIDRSFLARFGSVILSGGIASIPIALFTYQGELKLSPQQVWFVSKVLSYKWGSGLPYPSIKKMADETGVSRQQIHDYQKQLVKAGWLKVINRRNALGGKDSNLFDFSPLFQALEELLGRDHPDSDSGSGSPAGRVEPQGSRGFSTPHVNHSLHTHVKSSLHTYVNHSLHEVEEDQVEEIKVEELSLSKRSDAEVDSLRQSPDPPADTAPTRVGELLSQAQTRLIVSNRGRPPKPTPAIAHYVTDLSSLYLHDEEHTRSNITRAMRLFRASGKSEADFISTMLEAKAITLDWADNIKKKTADPGVKNRAPYFFAVRMKEESRAEEKPPQSDSRPQTMAINWETVLDEPPPPEVTFKEDEVGELDMLWQKVLIELASQMTSANYSTWFRETKLARLEKDKALVVVPTQFQQEHLSLRFTALVNKVLSSIYGSKISTGFIILSDIKK